MRKSLLRIIINYTDIIDLTKLLLLIYVIFKVKQKSLFNLKNTQNEFYITRIAL